MKNLLLKTPYKFKKMYGGTPELHRRPPSRMRAWLRGPSLKGEQQQQPALEAHRGPGISCYTGVFCFGPFRRNFAENGPQNLKMIQKDASRNSTQYVIKISS
jgi:hypothetical protein